MTDQQRFELDLGNALRAYAGTISSDLDAARLARTIASAGPQRRTRAIGIPWPSSRMLRLALTVLALALLLGLTLLVGVGVRPPIELPAVVPTVPGVYACPPSSTPDRPGDVDQERPPLGEIRIAVDRESGQLIAVAPSAAGDASEAWAFDLCTNTWARLGALPELPSMTATMPYELTYDWRRDLIVLAGGARAATYSFEADLWMLQAQPAPAEGSFNRLVYDAATGDVLLLAPWLSNGATAQAALWRYDVGSDDWVIVSQSGPGPTTRQGDHTEIVYDPAIERAVAFNAETAQTWLLDTRTDTWVDLRIAPPALTTGYFAFGGEAAYDEAAARTVFFADGRVATYDAAAGRWEVVFSSTGDADGMTVGLHARGMHRMVYDPTNGRLVVLGGSYRLSDGWVTADDVWAFETATGTWTLLLAASHIVSD